MEETKTPATCDANEQAKLMLLREIFDLAQHVYDQARLAHGSLDSEGLERFLRVNSELINEMEG